MGIRQRIIEMAQRKDLDYKALAKQSGLPRPTIHRYLAGKNDLTGGRIDRLLDVLGLAVGRRRSPRRPQIASLYMQAMTGTRPLFRYPGSKWRLMKDFVKLMPLHQHFVVPFGGSGADILRKPPSPLETFNDLDGDIYNLYSLLQDDLAVRRLKRRLVATPAQSQRHFEEALAVMKAGADPVDRAWAFLVASFQGFCVTSPSLHNLARWRYARKPHATAKNWFSLETSLDLAAARFRAVQLTNMPWQEAIHKTDTPTTLFLIDPPYFPGTVPRQLYSHGMTESDHAELLAVVQRVKGLVMLCGYDNPLYAKELVCWRKIAFGQLASLGVNGVRDKRSDLLWMNYDETGNRVAV
jgi:DNA adenine methylase